jgi:hypothetical protein
MQEFRVFTTFKPSIFNFQLFGWDDDPQQQVQQQARDAAGEQCDQECYPKPESADAKKLAETTGNTGEIQVWFHKNSWGNYTETGDYSYDATKTGYADWNKVTLYQNGTLVWGTEP